MNFSEKKVQIESAIAELHVLADEADFPEDASDFRKIARNLALGEWKAAYHNTWEMDTCPREGISSKTYDLICLLGEL